MLWMSALRCLQRIGVIALVLALPSFASAGDCPLFTVGDWGVGKIDGHVMFYLGEGRYLDTPIPAPREGPRWDVVYAALPFALGGTIGAALLSRRRRRMRPAR
jgi:hypothetical protein